MSETFINTLQYYAAGASLPAAFIVSLNIGLLAINCVGVYRYLIADKPPQPTEGTE